MAADYLFYHIISGQIPSKKVFDAWVKYGALGPPTLLLALFGPKPKKKRGH